VLGARRDVRYLRHATADKVWEDTGEAAKKLTMITGPGAVRGFCAIPAVGV